MLLLYSLLSTSDIADLIKLAYFDYALDAALGIVHRPTFEAQLRSYLTGDTINTDVAWHALRNAIYASGCRLHLSGSSSFEEANRAAWAYLENALALYTDTLLFRSSITSVQAMAVMV